MAVCAEPAVYSGTPRMPHSASLTFSDPDAYRAAIRAAEVELVVTDKGDFHSELTKIDLHRLWMQSGRENLGRVFYGKLPRGMLK